MTTVRGEKIKSVKEGGAMPSETSSENGWSGAVAQADLVQYQPWRTLVKKLPGQYQGESLWLSPFVLFDGFAMHQFTLIAICLGLASSALGTCTSSIPSR